LKVPGFTVNPNLRLTDLETAKLIARKALPPQLFAEGLTRIDQFLYQLTWRAGTGIIYRLPFLKPVAQFNYSGQGWGLAFDGRYLIMSDGSDTLRFMNPTTYALVARRQGQRW